MNIKLLEVSGWKQAIKGARLSFNSESDSGIIDGVFCIGKADDKLLTKLVKSGNSHSKFMRMIQVWIEIKAPLYWWKQCDTYKTGTTTSSESTMHTIHNQPLTADVFSIDSISTDPVSMQIFVDYLHYIERIRQTYIDTKNKQYWRQLIQMLPSSFNQTRIINLNYQVLRTIVGQRENHRLQEWSVFCEWVKSNMPYSYLITA